MPAKQQKTSKKTKTKQKSILLYLWYVELIKSHCTQNFGALTFVFAAAVFFLPSFDYLKRKEKLHTFWFKYVLMRKMFNYLKRMFLKDLLIPQAWKNTISFWIYYPLHQTCIWYSIICISSVIDYSIPVKNYIRFVFCYWMDSQFHSLFFTFLCL